VSIAGPVGTIEVVLFDGYDGDLQSGSMSINLSSVSYCVPENVAPGNWTDEIQTFNDPDMDLRLYPNPSSGTAYIEFASPPEQARITVRDILGRLVDQQSVWGTQVVELNLSNTSAQQILFVTVEVKDQPIRTLKLLLID